MLNVKHFELHFMYERCYMNKAFYHYYYYHRLQIIDHIRGPKEGWGGSLYWTLNRFTSQKAWDYYRINKVVVQFITEQSAAFNRDTAAPPYAATLKNKVAGHGRRCVAPQGNEKNEKKAMKFIQ
ncbi:putative capsid protein [Anguilla anguilla circovirus]|nr:putative capsid protein [Anguilla anguilla circovirus]